MHRENCGNDHMPVTQGYMRALYPLLHGLQRDNCPHFPPSKTNFPRLLGLAMRGFPLQNVNKCVYLEVPTTGLLTQS